jgi:hypothetical protein
MLSDDGLGHRGATDPAAIDLIWRVFKFLQGFIYISSD